MTELYFLRPDNKVHKEVLRRLLQIIKESDKLLFCVSYFTHIEIADAIIERVKLRKETLIILNTHDILRPDGPSSTTIKVSGAIFKIFENVGRLYRANDNKKYPSGKSNEEGSFLKVKLVGRDSPNDSLQSIMHQKFIVGDDKIVAFGSLNFTRNAFQNNFENICFSGDKEIIKSFRDEFYGLWMKGDDFSTVGGRIRCLKCPICKIEGMIDFESYGVLCTNCEHRFKRTDFEE